jgi:anaerobic selenocysteine-containing dehydrogenase
MPETPTFCRVCEPACGLVAVVEDGALLRLKPDREHPVTKGFACHKGLAGDAIHRDPDRLDHPQRRAADGGFERISWDDAATEIAAKLRTILDEDGPDAIASYIGNPTAFNTLVGPAIGSFFGQLGARRTFSSGTQDCANKFAGAEAVFGSSTVHPVPDIRNTDVLWIFGENPRVSHMSFLAVADPVGEIRAAVKRGATVRYFNPRRIETGEAGTGTVTWIRPDTDTYLLAALVHECFAAGLAREDVLREHGSHVEELRAFVAKHPAERAAAVTGIPADEIRRLAREFSEAPRAALHMSTGVNMGRQGTLAYWLLHMLSLVTGNLDGEGGNIHSRGFYPTAARSGRGRPEEKVAETRHGKLRRGALPGNLMADELQNGEPRVRALFVLAGNPVLSIGGEQALREAIAGVELVVCIDLYRNATGELADYLLPSADMFERADVNITGLGLQMVPYVQYTDAVVPPRAERREEWWILARLEQALGLKSVLDQGEAPPLFGRIDHMMKGAGTSLEEVRANPHGVVLPPLAPGRFYSDSLQTDDGRVDCCPPFFAEALERCEAICCELEAEGTERLKLISWRTPNMHNSWYHNVEKLKRARTLENPLAMRAEDAQARGLGEGDKVRCTSRWGAVEATVAFDDELMPGVVAMTHGWGNAKTPGMQVASRHPGVNSNALLPSGPESFDPLSSQAFMTGIPVEVEPLA